MDAVVRQVGSISEDCDKLAREILPTTYPAIEQVSGKSYDELSAMLMSLDLEASRGRRRQGGTENRARADERRGSLSRHCSRSWLFAGGRITLASGGQRPVRLGVRFVDAK